MPPPPFFLGGYHVAQNVMGMGVRLTFSALRFRFHSYSEFKSDLCVASVKDGFLCAFCSTL